MNSIKYMVTVVAAICTATTVSLAQRYSIIPNDTIEVRGILEDLQTLSIQQINVSNDTIILKWRKLSESVPPLWEAAICDNSVCNASLVDSGTMSPVFPNEYGLLLLHITPYGEPGTARIRYEVWDDNNPVRKDTLTFICTAVGSLNIYEKIMDNLKVFPNPTNNDFIIITKNKNGVGFSITDITGKIVLSKTFESDSSSVNTDNYPNGIYTISIFDKQMQKQTFKLVIQH